MPVIRLCLSRCAYRAVSCASTTVDASTLIDNVRCTLGNSFYWAAGCANAAADAIFGNLICHDISSFSNNNIYTRSIARAKQFVNTPEPLENAHLQVQSE